LDENIGKGTAEELAEKARQTVKFSTAELEEMIQKYKDLIKKF
jgi:hypothetical protein